MSLKETVSLYRISKELALEEEHGLVVQEGEKINVIKKNETAFGNYKKEHMKQMADFLKVKDISKSLVKKGKGYVIPIDSKEYIKFWLRRDKSKYIKIVKDKGFEGLTYTQWKELINELAEYCTRDIKDQSEKEQRKNEIFAQHFYFSNERHNQLVDKFSEWLKEVDARYKKLDNENNSLTELNEDIENEKFGEDLDTFEEGSHRIRFFNENDVIALYDYFEEKLEQCFAKFEEVADLFNGIREIEIEDKSIQAIDENKNPDDITYDDSQLILEEAIKDFNNK